MNQVSENCTLLLFRQRSEDFYVNTLTLPSPKDPGSYTTFTLPLNKGTQENVERSEKELKNKLA